MVNICELDAKSANCPSDTTCYFDKTLPYSYYCRCKSGYTKSGIDSNRENVEKCELSSTGMPQTTGVETTRNDKVTTLAESATTSSPIIIVVIVVVVPVVVVVAILVVVLILVVACRRRTNADSNRHVIIPPPPPPPPKEESKKDDLSVYESPMPYYENEACVKEEKVEKIQLENIYDDPILPTKPPNLPEKHM